ncbi:MAG: VWA domain-containing protein [Pirellulales bacterium]|nr:VWA domain-containing protein [Pirellulales bacterium]
MRDNILRQARIPRKNQSRRGATLVLFAFFLIVILAMVAFAVDLGHVMLVRTQLQVAADAAAMAAAKEMSESPEAVIDKALQFGKYHTAAGKSVEINPSDVELGVWDSETRRFTPTKEMGNAIRVTTRRNEQTGGEVPLFFAKILNLKSFEMKASAVAMATPRDIAFVVDLSGSMNDDTETCWATSIINSTFAPQGYASVGSGLGEKVFQDFDYGSFPGTVEYIGSRLGAPENSSAYAKLTQDNGLLSSNNIPEKYRILKSDGKLTKKQKAYSAIIDFQLAVIMPNAKPAPDSSSNYAYWEEYLDYIIQPNKSDPPNQSKNRITGFNNPNLTAYPSAKSSTVKAFRNMVGYLTYVQFMMDFGRDIQPDGIQYVALSTKSPYCPWNTESTAGGEFSFPPRSQPVHACRRALIAAMQVVKERNEPVGDDTQKDWVSVISFDRLSNGGPIVKQSLTADYEEAMETCTRLQACGDISASTATDAGMKVAREHIRSKDDGGEGRRNTNKIVVLLTDGAPNLTNSSTDEVADYIKNSNSSDFYPGNKLTHNGPLTEAGGMNDENWKVYPVGIGLGTNYDFMDRMARIGGSSNKDGQSPRGSGNPAEYEKRLADIFREIITNPEVRLVQ